jgi:putative redox protein
VRSERHTFPNKAGHQLSAVLDLPDDSAPDVFALFAHCFTCSKSTRAAVNIAGSLTDAGIGVLRFDFTGLGQSEGEFADTTFSSNVDDLVSAAEFLGSSFAAPQILIGHSLGGAAVIQAAHRIADARAVVTIAAPSEPSHVRKLMAGEIDTIESEGQANVTIAGRTFTIRKQFLDDLEQTRMRDCVHDLRRALLVFHSPMDKLVGIDNATGIYEAALHPKSFVSLDGADHLLTNEMDSRYVGAVVAAWSTRYLEGPAPEASDEPPQDAVVVHTGRARYRTRIRSGRHAYLADEPEELGGTDLGPSPYDYLLSALGACTAITLRMYADRKEWPMEAVTVTLRHEKIHAADCESCETETGKVDHIERVIQFEGPLDDDQKARLLEIADRCPVHRTLHSEIRIDTTLSRSG